MERDKYIESAIRGVLRNPILPLMSMREIGIGRVLRQSNFVKREVGYSTYQVLLHFVYMLVMHKRLSSFVRQSPEAFGKDVYYRFLRNGRFNWRKLLLLSAVSLIRRIEPLQRPTEPKVLIINDTVEPKAGSRIEGSCDAVWSNKEKRPVRGVNIVSLNYSDSYTTLQLDFSIGMNRSRRIDPSEFTAKLHHRSNAYTRRIEGLRGKNALALEMLKRALDEGVDADYLLVDSWYAKPGFVHEVQELGLPLIARIAKNNSLWCFQGKARTLEALYRTLSKVKAFKRGEYGKIRYRYFDAIVSHEKLGRIKLLFLHTGKELLVFLSTDLSLQGKEIIDLYKKRWNIEQGYKDLREHFGLGQEENRLYEALIARITLSMFTYNLVSYLNRIQHEPKTLEELFRELECELETLAISMKFFLEILTRIAQVDEIVKENRDLITMIALLDAYTRKELGFMCES